MHFSFALIALVAAGVVNAQFPDIPNCALSCLVGPLTSDGCSSLTDFACHCQKPDLISQVSPCLEKSCNSADQSTVAGVVAKQCEAAGHPIAIPNLSAGSATTSSAAPSESVAPPLTTAVPSLTSIPGYYPTPSSATPPSIPVGTGMSSSTSISTSTVTSPPFLGAASNVRGNMPGIAAIAAAVAYFL
ncbi:hypothetical protein Egran_04924 [Elaphomyces granulatus]|uniref:CFEM domain-containing protein n=1 Tax=Elaphomyces granulatus TaxID=519963 RepID=A0A232LT04_9EURO|nr:hypothetical protein Egran_04924 [Elaphomyces granulatus]